MTTTKKFIINGLIITITTLFLRCIAMFFNSYISTRIGSEAVGLYGLVMSVYAFVVTIALSGINLAITKIVSEEQALGNSKKISKIMKTGLVFSFIFGGTASILLVSSAPIICKYCLHNRISSVPFYIISVSLPFISMASCISGYFTATRNSIKPASEQILEQLLKLILITFFLNYFISYKLESICISLILGNIISEIISFIFIYILYKFDIKKHLGYTRCQEFFEKRILSITIPVGLTSFIRSGLSTIKQVLIPFGFEKYGNSYSQALSNYGFISGMAIPLVLFPNIIILAFSSLIIPEYSALKVKKESSKIQRLTKRILKYCLYFSVLVSVLLYLYSQDLSILFYKTTSVSRYIKLLAPLVPFMYIDSVIDAMLRGLDKHVEVLKINIIDLITSIILILILIPKFGITGYIIMIYYSEILNFTLSYLTLRKTNLKT